ncbi:MAG: translation initiation factor IF-2 [Planctomycetia bacterium]|nr:translation initiation factor IF-2 [Planctomycetia bacterium]
MSIRIYALAKQLKVESKLLVDVCKKLGLEGKGSALASLTDEEVQLVTDYFTRTPILKTAKDLISEVVSMPLQKPSVSLHTGKVPVLKPSRPSRLSELTKPSERSLNDIVTENQKKEELSSNDQTSPTIPSQDEIQSDSQASQEQTQKKQVQEDHIETETFVQDQKTTKKQDVANEKFSDQTASSVTQSTSPELDQTSSKTRKKADSSTEKAVLSPLSKSKTDSQESLTPAEVVESVSKDQKETEDQKIDVDSSNTEIIEEVSVENVAVQEDQTTSPVETSDISSDLPDESIDIPETSTLTSKEIPSSSSADSSDQQTIVDVTPKDNSTLVAPTKNATQTISEPKEEKKPERRLSRPGKEKKSPDVNRDSAAAEEPREKPNRGRNESNKTKAAANRNIPSPIKPQPLVRPSFISPIDQARQEALNEMKRPPLMVAPSSDKMVVLDQKKKKKLESDENGKKIAASNKPGLAIHLAPLPTQPIKPSKKKSEKEPAPQKPAKRFSPDEIRAEMEKTQRPLTEHIKEGREKKRTKGGKLEKPEKSPNVANGTRPNKDRFPKKEVKKKPFIPVIDEPDLLASAKFNTKKGSGKTRPDSDFKDELRSGKKERRNTNIDNRRSHNVEFETGSEFHFSRQIRQKKNKTAVSTVPRKNDINIEMPCTVKQFAEATGLSAASIIKKLMEFGVLKTINHNLDEETVELLIVAFDLKATIKKEKSLEEEFVSSAFELVDTPESLVPRPPVITFLGHVDHGKTSLLDRILHLNVVSGEKGGITQHIRAYRIKTPNGDVTFVDTPGHEAFTEMRARGANCTDIAVLVVAADDGVMPQTEEAISHARAAGVPIVVALNKMDLPGVKKDKTVQELAANDIMPSEWGGDVEIVETSAISGMGIDSLLETLLTVSELHELKANPNRPAVGVALESSMLPGQGVVCKILVQKGTLRPGDIVLCGNAYGRVRSMFDTLDPQKHLDEAGPSTPVTLLGLDVAPSAGSKFVVLDNISVARQIAEERTKFVHDHELSDIQTHMTLETLFDRMNTAKTQQTLNIIIRADVRGSIEAIRKELGKLEHPEVKVKILQASVGGITEADVHLADASDAIIVGFNVVPDEGARTLAEKKKVQIRRYDIIYKLTEDIKAALEGMLKPLEQVKELGRAIVQRTFIISRIGTIAGCRVMAGMIERDARVRLIRESRIIGDYPVETLKREKNDAREVREGYECGIKLKNFNDIKEGDIFEAYKIEEIARTF